MYKLFSFFILIIGLMFLCIGYYSQVEMQEDAYYWLQEKESVFKEKLGDKLGGKTVDILTKVLVLDYNKGRFSQPQESSDDVESESLSSEASADSKDNGPADAEVPVQDYAQLELKNGFKVEGKIVSENERIIVLMVDGQRALFKVNEIKSKRLMTESEFQEVLSKYSGQL